MSYSVNFSGHFYGPPDEAEGFEQVVAAGAESLCNELISRYGLTFDNTGKPVPGTGKISLSGVVSGSRIGDRPLPVPPGGTD